VGEGGNHRTILPAIQALGYAGSANAIYQYILKKRNEETPGTGIGEAIHEGAPPRPAKVSIQRVTKTAVYKFVLREAAAKRASEAGEAGEADEAAGRSAKENDAPPELEWEKAFGKASAFYSESIAGIIAGTKKDAKCKKKTVKPDYAAVAEKNPVVGMSIEFLTSLYRCVDNADIQELDRFIAEYRACGIRPFERYAKGLGEDYDAVKSAILNRDINNGMTEGFNNKIKLLRKIRYGRAKEALINAVSVLSTRGRFRYSDYPAVKYSPRKLAA